MRFTEQKLPRDLKLYVLRIAVCYTFNSELRVFCKIIGFVSTMGSSNKSLDELVFSTKKIMSIFRD